ncbi:hypothetical protein A3A60_04665 [Candidatus Curtissbacteria bacterium RIFCSPLOWO2_01_FULL_42_26]|uniref:Glucosamine/galactosamine-6-phosphate isomerase domain-containing protein n=1 Tax=Candidatus Curtissbacteria bacterium RIFCSPLOWO2_01_FULL_42_26 TaxID=1797729 RepID=A0A1F5I1N1_9BACT|nr:MAG: hypothetical protein A3A60_04665 [Candidatus Curtissbacteria bacterium RIFCSPLOWO2_01_FULL_42_26]
MINIVKVKDRDEGQRKAHDLLKKSVDKDTLLALSGGTSVDYRAMIVKSSDILPGAICVVDERYGEEFHKNSNELLLKNQGIKSFADKECIETHKILKGKDFRQTAKIYEKEIEDLFKRFPKKVGVMGVGANMHTAGIFPNSDAAHSADFVVAEEVDDQYPKRITLTLKALGEFTNFIIMMFGPAKQNALKMLLDEKINDMQKFPAIFYRKARIKSYLITDISL